MCTLACLCPRGTLYVYARFSSSRCRICFQVDPDLCVSFSSPAGQLGLLVWGEGLMPFWCAAQQQPLYMLPVDPYFWVICASYLYTSYTEMCDRRCRETEGVQVLWRVQHLEAPTWAPLQVFTPLCPLTLNAYFLRFELWFLRGIFTCAQLHQLEDHFHVATNPS
jgi:hypothetical protein